MVLTSDTTATAASTRCELIGNLPCSAVAAGKLFLPEWFVLEAVGSFLVPCLYRHCTVFDLGANLGFVTAYMASLGAHVTAIEPQPNLASALQRTVVNNCWQQRVHVHNAFISLSAKDKGKQRTENFNAVWNVASAHGGGTKASHNFTSPYFMLTKALISAKHVDFIKLDIDSIEAQVVNKLYHLVNTHRFNFTTLIFEVNVGAKDAIWLLAEAFLGFQRLGYNIYKFNQHEQRHWFDARGVDLYASGPKAYADSPFVEERFSQRFMRHLLWYRPETRRRRWERHLYDGMQKRAKELHKPFYEFTNSFLITREELLEPIPMETFSVEHPSAEGMAYHRGKNERSATK